ncbi:MAG: hypothetical protein JKX94_00665 [Sneathiella sp.]|nr:hypothetical protein [Sneathiella sp.]
MKKSVFRNCFAYLVTSLIVTLFTVPSAHSALIGVGGPLSNIGTPAAIIGAPALINNITVTNTGQQGFDEMQNVLLGAALAVDAGNIASGMTVDSHMIFFNRTPGSGAASHFNVQWTFSGTILGVMSDSNGNLEAASNGILGAAGTIYPGAFINRGLETLTDGYSVLGSVLTVGMRVSSPGDWIRVVTASSTLSVIPLPAGLPLYGAGIALLSFIGWCRRSRPTMP